MKKFKLILIGIYSLILIFLGGFVMYQYMKPEEIKNNVVTTGDTNKIKTQVTKYRTKIVYKTKAMNKGKTITTIPRHSFLYKHLIGGGIMYHDIDTIGFTTEYNYKYWDYTYVGGTFTYFPRTKNRSYCLKITTHF